MAHYVLSTFLHVLSTFLRCPSLAPNCCRALASPCWRSSYGRKRRDDWSQEYASRRDELHGCCVDNLNVCLEQAGKKGASGAAASEASSECLRRFSPDHQQLATATPAETERAACEAKLEQLRAKHTQELTEFRQTATERSESQARQCDQRVETAEAAGKQATERQAAAASAQAQEADRTKANLRSCETTVAQVQEERGRLQATLAQVVVHPGTEVLAAFPAGTGSLGLVVGARGALAAGFLLGLPGWTGRWARLGAGMLLVSLGLIGRLFLLLRRRGRERYLPEDAARLDEAEADILKHWRDAE